MFMYQNFGTFKNNLVPSFSGMIRYIIGRVENSIYVYLRNVELTPRDGKETCNFKVKVLLIPINDSESECFTSKSTRVYHGTNNAIFDIEEDPETGNDHTFKFHLFRFRQIAFSFWFFGTNTNSFAIGFLFIINPTNFFEMGITFFLSYW